MKNELIKKYIVLGILFIFPIVIYLFFALGVNNFAKLPVLTQSISELDKWDSLNKEKVKLSNHISVLCFWGDDVLKRKSDGFNLNQKIYKRFYEFKDFQFVVVVKEGNQDSIIKFKNELIEGVGTDLVNWKFIFGNEIEINNLYDSLNSDTLLSSSLSSSIVFIIDKERNLRGRDDDDKGTLFGYDSSSVAEINNKMVDDVKVILAEYRLALKKNNNNGLK